MAQPSTTLDLKRMRYRLLLDPNDEASSYGPMLDHGTMCLIQDDRSPLPLATRAEITLRSLICFWNEHDARQAFTFFSYLIHEERLLDLFDLPSEPEYKQMDIAKWVCRFVHKLYNPDERPECVKSSPTVGQEIPVILFFAEWLWQCRELAKLKQLHIAPEKEKHKGCMGISPLFLKEACLKYEMGNRIFVGPRLPGLKQEVELDHQDLGEKDNEVEKAMTGAGWMAPSGVRVRIVTISD